MTKTERIEQLKNELDKGNRALVDMEQKQQTLRSQLLRISGAIQVLTEIEREEKEEGTDGIKSV